MKNIVSSRLIIVAILCNLYKAIAQINDVGSFVWDQKVSNLFTTENPRILNKRIVL